MSFQHGPSNQDNHALLGCLFGAVLVLAICLVIGVLDKHGTLDPILDYLGIQ